MALGSYCFTFNFFSENTYILFEDSGSAVIIDPGCSNEYENWQLEGFFKETGLQPKAIWLTHAHIDHVLGLSFCTERWDIPYFLHPLEVAQLKAVEIYAPNYGVHDFVAPTNPPNLIEKPVLSLGSENLEVLFVPGHSPGHVAFYHAQSGKLWVGDVLFNSSIGRTDLPGGDFDVLAKSIREQLYVLPDETYVYPGHGLATQIGVEKRTNSFVRA